jgi:Mg2+ and Co2+ transporter CorA
MYTSKPPPTGPPRDSIYHDIVFWAKKADTFGLSPLNPAESMHTPILALLHLVSSEWLEVGEYIRTRLGQIEWEVSFPEHFLIQDSNINDTLKKLHIWRRLVPLYREMLTETLQRVFQVRDSHTLAVSGGFGDFTTTNSDADPIRSSANSTLLADTAHSTDRSILTMRDDYVRVLGFMEEYQQRIDRLTSVVTAVISIADSQRSREDNKNVARLTWLATFFIPLGFIASIFSMTDDISSIGETIKWYFAAALPLATVSLGIAMLFTMPSVKKYFSKIKFKRN